MQDQRIKQPTAFHFKEPLRIGKEHYNILKDEADDLMIQSDLCRLKLFHGPDVEFESDWTSKAFTVPEIHRTIFNGNTKHLKRLLKGGENPNLQIFDCPKIFQYDNNFEKANVGFFLGTTPLMIAAERGNLKAIRILLSYGAMVNHMDNLGLTAFAWACASNKKAACELLLSYNALVDLREDRGGMSPLLISCRLNLTDMASWLLDKGANVHSRDRLGRSALHYAAWNYNIKLMNLLYDRMAQINTKDLQGNIPLHLLVSDDRINEPDKMEDVPFCDKEQLYIDKLFKSMSAHLKDDISVTIDISSVISRGSDQSDVCEEYFALKHLINMGANIKAKNKKGETALHILASRLPNAVVSRSYVICEEPKLNQSVIIQMLMLQIKGANPETPDNRGSTPIDICFASENHLAIKALYKYSENNITIENWDLLKEVNRKSGMVFCEKVKQLEASIDYMIESIFDETTSIRDYAIVRWVIEFVQDVRSGYIHL